MRAYTKSGGKIAYGAWSDVWQSSKIEERTASNVSGYAFAKKAYAKIKKTGKKYGWTVGRLMRSSGMIMAPGGTAEVPLYSITCTNKSYRVSANLSGWTHEVFWAYVYDAKGNLVKEYHSAMALPSYEQAMVQSLSKGVLADLKRYSVKRKVPHLSLETIKTAEGGTVTVKMLNTSKAVTWDIVNENTLAKEANSEYAAAAKKALKLKKKSKTSVRLSIAKNAMPYSTFHAGYYLRATVGGKHYYAILSSAD